MISVEQAIEDLKNGKMLVMVDDVDRENEGDLVFASTFSSAEKVNFAITHARGVLCVALSPQIAQQLGLSLMVDKNTSSHETAFTVTIDAKDAKTGVSAYERNMTIELMSRVGARADDFVRPGHIFPLIAKSGGVLARTGHTEGSTDLCHLAGLSQSAVICEIVKDDGDMARRDDLEKFCAQHGINMISVAQIVQYRLKHETLVKFSEPKSALLCGEAAKFYDVSDHEGNEHRAYIFGEPEKSAQTNVMRDLDVLRKEGGVLLMLKSAQNRADFKSFGIGAQILAHLGVRKIKILSKSEPKDYAGLSGFGIDIV